MTEWLFVLYAADIAVEVKEIQGSHAGRVAKPTRPISGQI